MAAVVSVNLGRLQEDGTATEEDWMWTRRVLRALVTDGWAIFPQGKFDGWKRMLAEKEQVINGAYMDPEEPKKP